LLHGSAESLMSEIRKHEAISEALGLIFQGIKGLRNAVPNRAFTIDCRLVGNIGEVIAGLEYDITFNKVSQPVHDGRTSAAREGQGRTRQCARGHVGSSTSMNRRRILLLALAAQLFTLGKAHAQYAYVTHSGALVEQDATTAVLPANPLRAFVYCVVASPGKGEPLAPSVVKMGDATTSVPVQYPDRPLKLWGSSSKVWVFSDQTGPPGFTSNWAKTSLWRSAAAIPGVSETVDDGREARLFGAATSGQTMVYDRNGRLLFSGGITAARGHLGDNPGASAITALLEGPVPHRVRKQPFMAARCSLLTGPVQDGALRHV
jgi:hypothetical protein